MKIRFLTGLNNLILMICSCFATVLVLFGCASTPTYNSVLTEDYIQPVLSTNYSSLSLGFIITENTKKTIKFIDERNDGGGAQAHDALINFDAQYTVEKTKALLKKRFKRVVPLENINEAQRENVDICMLFDYRMEVKWVVDNPSYIFLGGIFVNLKGKVIEEIVTKHEKVVVFSGFSRLFSGTPEGGRFKPLAEEGVIKFAGAIDKSKKLVAFSKTSEYEAVAESTPAPAPAQQIEPIAPVQQAPQAIDFSNISFGKYHAIVIGNNNYQYIPKLNTAVNDAVAVDKILKEKYGFKTKLILNGTRRDILIEFDKYRSVLESNENLLIYYAGHGYFDEEAERGYWLPVEARRETKADWISNADISDSLKALRAKHVLIVADSCYSGTLTRGIKIAKRQFDYFQRMAKKKSRTVLTSGGIEPVMDSGGGNHSVFCKAFIDILDENEKILDGTLLFSKIRRPVITNAPQTPQYSDIRFAGHDGGDFLFVKTK